MRTHLYLGTAALVAIGTVLATPAAGQATPPPAATQDVPPGTGNPAAPTAAGQDQAPGSEPADPSGVVPQDAPAAEDTRDIVVTGSLIARRDFTAESPIATVNKDFIQNAGPATLEQSLNVLPQLQATQGSQTSGSTTGGPGTSGGRSNANLRGLGVSRTLILLDGRRLQPSDPLGGVDLNTISPGIISSVETITGGASATYGSDAIAGVINIRTDTGRDGFRVDADFGMTEAGDGQNVNLSTTWRGKFADNRGRALLSLGYYDRSTVSRNERRFFDARDGGTSFPRGLVVIDGSNAFGAGTAAANAAYNGLWARYGTTVPRGSSLAVNRDGTLFGRTGGQNLRDGALDGYILRDGSVTRLSPYDASLQVPLERYSAFGNVSYEIGSGIEAYGQVFYTNYETDQLNESGIFQSITGTTLVPVTNPFVTADLRTALAARPRPTAPFQYYFNGERIGRLQIINQYDVAQFIGGLKGTIPGIDWRWDAYGSFGRTRQTEIANNQVSRSAFDRLINAADGGRSICDGGYDLFSSAPVSEGCRRYLAISSANRYRIEQTVANATASGALFALPGGDAQAAVGLEYRRNRFRADIDLANQNRAATVNGITTFLQPEALGISGSQSGGGFVEVKEAFAELLLPFLRDTRFFQNLEIDLAYRFSDYNRIGSVHTYKAGANWSPFDGLGFRGGYSRAIRAPGVGELFAPQQGFAGTVGSVASGQGDPCDITGAARGGRLSGVDPARVRALCLATGVPTAVIDTYRFAGTAVSAFRVGNPALREETADSYTIGGVLSPKFGTDLLKNVSLSVDYYRIKLTEAVGRTTTQVALRNCFNATGQNPNYDPTLFDCTLINRDASGILSFSNEPLFNLGSYSTRGLDFQLDLRSDFGSIGSFGINSLVSYVIDYKIQTLPGQPTLDYAGTIGNGQIDGFSISHPAWKHTTTFTYFNTGGSLSLRWRFIDAMDNAANVGVVNGVAVGVPERNYFDLIGRIVATDTLEFRAGVNNLLDEQPPTFGGPSSTDGATYDIVGRRFFLGVTKRF